MRDLPEPGPDGRTRHFWSPPCEGLDYAAACDPGTELALEAVQHMRAKDLPAPLAWAVTDMPAAATADVARKGVMVGPLETLARLAMDAATPERLALYERPHAERQAFWRRLVAEEAERERAKARRRARRTAGRAGA